MVPRGVGALPAPGGRRASEARCTRQPLLSTQGSLVAGLHTRGVAAALAALPGAAAKGAWAAASSPPAEATLAGGALALATVSIAIARRRAAGAAPHGRTATRAKTILEPGEKVVGIDLGTTNSAVAAFEAGKPTVIPNAEGARTTPSVVAYSKAGELLIGQIARRQAITNPQNTYYSVKRFMGRQPKEVRKESTDVSYQVETAGRQVRLRCPQLAKKLAPEDVSAQVLRKLATDAGAFLGAEVKKAVVTVPAYFNDSQRQATKDAGTIAGLDVLRILNEPTAASLAYGLEKNTNETIMVFDLGGGTFDVSILSVGDGVCEVLATSGDSHLGGDDFDKRIVDWLAEGFREREGIDLFKDSQALQRLTEAAEKAKIELSGMQDTSISLPFIATDETGPKHIEEVLSRAKFESLCGDLVDCCRGPVEQALQDAALSPSEINEVVLVGGSTRIPAVQALARQLSGGRAPNQSVNPDEVVAVGAAVQAAVLTGEIRDLVLLDVIPLSLSIDTKDGISSVFMPRNTRVPMKKTKLYSTYKDNQDKVSIKVVQGERRFAKDNKELGTFILDGIPQAPAGETKIEVTFDVDSNGILQVMAKDRKTLKEQSVTITGASTLAPEDVERKVDEARAAAAEDARRQGIRQIKNDAESVVFNLERVLQERRAKMDQMKVEVIESKVLLLRQEVMKPELDVELVQEITEDLESELADIERQKAIDAYDVSQGFAPEEQAAPKKRATL